MIYEINDFIEEYDLDIIDKKIYRDDKGHTKSLYKYKCRKCGFDCGEHYIKGNIKNENWVAKIKGCGCCNSFICVTGVNDIATTDEWMVSYFVNQEDALRFKAGSNEKVLMKCIYCGKEKLYKINDLYNKKRMTCDCCDNMSMPNKFAYYTFMQLIDKVKNYEREYQPKWAGKFRYDNYFEYQDKKYIVEMDGGLGHGNKTFGKDYEKDIKGLQRDIKKEELAREHDIILIRVNSQESTKEYLTYNLKNALYDIIDISSVNWDNVYKKCCSNEIKNICDYYSENIDNYTKLYLIDNIMTSYFHISNQTIRKYLKIGREFGWCDYYTENEIEKKEKKNNLKIVCKIKREHPEYTVEKISRITNLESYIIRRYLNEGSKKDLCEYDGKQELSNSRKSITYVYDLKDFSLLREYESVEQCSQNSIKDFGVQFTKKGISMTCTGKFKSYRGYVFSHKLLETN